MADLKLLTICGSLRKGSYNQYDLRRAMVFLDAFTLNKPEIFIGSCTSKFDETTGEIKDDVTRNFIKQQLAAFAKFITQVTVKVDGQQSISVLAFLLPRRSGPGNTLIQVNGRKRYPSRHVARPRCQCLRGSSHGLAPFLK
jgi:hypothetical protein